MADKRRKTYPKNRLSYNQHGTKKQNDRLPIPYTRNADKMEIDYLHLYESLYRKEVTDWQGARALRYDPFNPVTYPLQQLYKDAMLDNHLAGAIESRILRITNKEFLIKDKKGNVDTERSLFVQKKWFRNLVRKAMESKFYGYSMVFINDFSSGNIRGFIDINRENVLPERELVLKDAINPSGMAVKYRMFPNNLIYIQLNANAIGILERVAPMTIYKRHSWASWDEYEQIFGIPIRIARTVINTEKHKNELQEWLEAMGTASYGIFDKQTDIEVKENPARGDAAKIYMDKINLINKEISKGIVGQTMTMDDGSSQSQAEVHLKIYQDYTDSDIMDIQDWVSDEFLPVMRNLGYDIPEGCYFELSEKSIVNPLEKIKIDAVLLQNGYNLTSEYIKNTYETELDEEQPRNNPFTQPEVLSLQPAAGRQLELPDERFFL
jgi:hypothetical protein